MKRSVVVFINGNTLKDLVPVKSSDVKRALNDFNPGTKTILTIKNYYRPKALSQLNVFFAVSVFLSKVTGHTVPEMKKNLKAHYGLWVAKLDKDGEVLFINGHAVFEPKSLSEYNTDEMSHLLDSIIGSMEDDFRVSFPDQKSYSQIDFEL